MLRFPPEHFRADEISVKPEGGLLYYPQPPMRPGAAASLYVEGEQVGFARSDLNAAALIYEQLAAKAEDAVRAGALTRLARVRRKMKNPDAAARAYSRLSEITGANVSGLPADLIAREGWASLFDETRQTAELRREAEAFLKDPRSRRWRLTKPQYEFYWSEAESWSGRGILWRSLLCGG